MSEHGLRPTGQVWPLLGGPGHLQANIPRRNHDEEMKSLCQGWGMNMEGTPEEESKGQEWKDSGIRFPGF